MQSDASLTRITRFAIFGMALLASGGIIAHCFGCLSKLSLVELTPSVQAKSSESDDLQYLRIFPLTEREREQLTQHHQIPPYFFPPTGYSPEPPTKSSERGEKLYGSLNCAECHSVGGKGGNVGPPLDGIGGHRGREWLSAHLSDPEKNVKEFSEAFGGMHNLMPHPKANTAEVKEIVDYLLTLAEPSGGFAVKAHAPIDQEQPLQQDETVTAAPTPEDIKSGRKLFSAQGCAACHSVGGIGGSFAPALDGVGLRLGRALIAAHVSPHGAKMRMPEQPGLTSQQIKEIIDYLMTLPPSRSEQKKN